MNEPQNRYSYKLYLISCLFRDVDEMIELGLWDEDDFSKNKVEDDSASWYDEIKENDGVYRDGSS